MPFWTQLSASLLYRFLGRFSSLLHADLLMAFNTAQTPALTSTRCLTGLLLLGLASGSVAAQEINFSTANFTITEGQPIDFALTLNAPAPAAGLTPFGDISTSGGNFGINAGTDQVFGNFAPGSEAVTATFVTSNDDVDEPDGTVTFTLTGALPPGSTIGSANTVTVTILDNDTAPAVVNPIDDQSVTEGESITIDISDTFADQDTLSYAVASSDTNIATATVSGTTLTVTGVAAGSTDITLSATDPDDASNNGAETVSETFSVTVPSGITFSSSVLTVDENDTTTYTVVLDSTPTDDVTVTPTSGNTDAASVSGALTFTDSNWNTVQTVTVTGVDDDNDDFESDVTISHAATSDDSNYTISDAGDVSVTTNDDDVTVSVSGPDTVVEGSSITITYTLSAPLAEALTVFDTGDIGDIILAGQTTVSYTLVSRDDDTVEADEVFTADIGRTDNPLITIATASHTYTVIDDDRDAGVILSATSGSAAEDGGEIEYTVLLDAPPTGSVTITPTSGDDTTADVSGALTFTTSNWFTPQTITVTGVDDDLVNASDRTATISHAASGGGYGSVTVGDFTFTATDDDIPVPGVTLSPTSGAAAEDGGTASYTVVLDTQPTGDVTITPTSGDDTTATVSGALTFTTANWDTAQTVTVTGVDDAIENSLNRTATISHAASGGGYGSVTVDAYTFTANDDDIPGLRFSTASLTVAEAGSTIYTVVLDTEPTADVTVTPTSGNTDAASVSGALTFTMSNWDTAQTVTVTGVDDANSASETFDITHAASGGGYDAVTGDVGVTTTDDDADGLSFTPGSVNVGEASTVDYTRRPQHRAERQRHRHPDQRKHRCGHRQWRTDLHHEPTGTRHRPSPSPALTMPTVPQRPSTSPMPPAAAATTLSPATWA